LDVIAVDPAAQRSGLGGKLMAPVFVRADAQHQPCFVLTHNRRNVGFYEKYGFRLVLDELLGKSGVSAYALVREAR
jgi:ribosomal protein S18 acetylase RimI-like enzyme